ncbi:MAG: urease accessory UreF family protein [Pseudomonadota bacterium]
MSTDDLHAISIALHLSDSQFPSGAFAFSWGLEAVVHGGIAGRSQLGALMACELEDRWAPFDRVFIHRSMQTESIEQLAVQDEQFEEMAWSDVQRRSSRRAGAALLTAHARLRTAGAIELRDALRTGQIRGHLPVVQGALFGNVGLSVPLALIAAGHGLLMGLASAAVRLGVAGAIEAHEHVSGLRARLAIIASETPPNEPSTFGPLLDIGMMRHAQAHSQLFTS